MGLYTENIAAMDEAYRTGEERVSVLLDGRQPAPVVAPTVTTTRPASTAPAAPAGPGFWSRLGSGLSAVGGNLADMASQVEFSPAPISGARGNALAALPPPPPPAVPWRLVAVVAAAVVVLAALLRRP